MICLVLEKDRSGGVKRELISPGGCRAVRRSGARAGHAQRAVLERGCALKEGAQDLLVGRLGRESRRPRRLQAPERRSSVSWEEDQRGFQHMARGCWGPRRGSKWAVA